MRSGEATENSEGIGKGPTFPVAECCQGLYAANALVAERTK